MRVLKEFAQVSAFTPKSGDQLRLYKLAMAGFTREEAKERLGFTDNYFNGLYKQLKDYMSLGVLNYPLKDMSRFQRRQCQIRRDYETAMMLILLEKREAGLPLARSTMRKAEQECMFQIALDITRRLRAIYGYVYMDKKWFKYFSEKQLKYKQELNWELEAEDLFYQYSHQHLQGKMLPGVEEKLSVLAKFPATSHRFHYMRYLCQVVHYQVTRQEKAMLATCREALAFFKKYKNLPYVINFSFSYRAIAYHLAQREFAQAELAINESIEPTTRGEKNWQILMVHRALLGFHSAKIAIAKDSYQKAIKVPKKLRTEQVQERWRIIRAYLELFDRGTGTWRLAKFLNSFPYSQSDKSGPILSVHIAELLHLLKQGKFEAYRYRCERMTAYIDRYLNKKKELIRFVHFFRLLQCVVRGGFRRKEATKKGKLYLNKLQSSTPRIGADVREVEVVPFERLWEMVLGCLR